MKADAALEAPVGRRRRVAAGLGIAGGVTLTFGSILQFLLVSSYAVGAYRAALLIGILLGLLALLGGLLLVLRPSWNLPAGILLMASGLAAFRGYSYGGPYALGELLAITGGTLVVVQTRRFASWVPRRLPSFLAGHFLAGLVFLGGGAFMFYEAWSAYWSILTCYGGYSGPCFTPFFLLLYGFAFLIIAAFFLAWALGHGKGLVVLGVAMAASGLTYPLWTQDGWTCIRTLSAPFSLLCSGVFRWVFLGTGAIALISGLIAWARQRRGARDSAHPSG